MTEGLDGIAFVMQESSNTLDRTGGGAGIGYLSRYKSKLWLMESFTLLLNLTHTQIHLSLDPANDHMGIQLDGDSGLQ